MVPRKGLFFLLLISLFTISLGCSSTKALKAPSNPHTQEVNYCEKVQVVTSNVKSNEAVKFTLIGSVKDKKYHCLDCKEALNIKTEDEIWFADLADAAGKGFTPCEECGLSCKVKDCENEDCPVETEDNTKIKQ